MYHVRMHTLISALGQASSASRRTVQRSMDCMIYSFSRATFAETAEKFRRYPSVEKRILYIKIRHVGTGPCIAGCAEAMAAHLVAVLSRGDPRSLILLSELLDIAFRAQQADADSQRCKF